MLILHIDRALPWREIAMVMHEGDDSLDDAGLERESARLRKRFERVKAELKELAEMPACSSAERRAQSLGVASSVLQKGLA